MKKIFKTMAVVTSVAAMMNLAGCGENNVKEKESEIPTLKWYVPGAAQDGTAEVMEAVNKIIEPKIGAKLDLIFIEDGAYNEKMTMYMASGEEFDMLFTGYLFNGIDAAKKGGLMPLKELMEKNTPNLFKSMPEYAWKSISYEDDYYAVPNEQIWAMGRCVSFRKDLVEKYNFDVSKVKYYEDVEPFLDIILKNEPELYPTNISYLMNPKEAYDDDPLLESLMSGDAVYYSNRDNKVYAYYDAPYKYETFKKLHEWYEKGYIRKDIAVAKDTSSDVKLGKYAVTSEVYKPGVEKTIQDSRGGIEYVCVPIGNSPFIANTSAGATAISISATSRHADKAIKLIELLNTDKELYNMVCFGIEGKHYTKTGENRIELAEQSNYKPLNAWKFGNQFNSYILPGQDDDVWEQTKAMNDSADVSKICGVVLNSDNIKTELAQISKLTSQYIISVFNKGAEDPDKYWEECKKAMKDAGIEKVVAEYQKQIDEFNASQNK